MKYILGSLIIIVLLFSTAIYTSCTKDKCKGVYCMNGGSCSSGMCLCPADYTGSRCETYDPVSPVITYHNNTYTTIYITVNGTSRSIPVGGSVSFSGVSGNPATGTATTSGVTSTGTQIGLEISWTIADVFSAGAQTIDLNVSSDFFFLKLVNKSSYVIGPVYVNYGLTSQTIDNITIPTDGALYNIGYYRAYTNSRLYLMSGSHYWDYNINLSFSQNQYFLFTAS